MQFKIQTLIFGHERFIDLLKKNDLFNKNSLFECHKLLVLSCMNALLFHYINWTVKRKVWDMQQNHWLSCQEKLVLFFIHTEELEQQEQWKCLRCYISVRHVFNEWVPSWAKFSQMFRINNSCFKMSGAYTVVLKQYLLQLKKLKSIKSSVNVYILKFILNKTQLTCVLV